MPCWASRVVAAAGLQVADVVWSATPSIHVGTVGGGSAHNNCTGTK